MNGKNENLQILLLQFKGFCSVVVVHISVSFCLFEGFHCELVSVRSCKHAAELSVELHVKHNCFVT